MGKSGGGGNTNTVQNADPWKGVQPFLTGGQPTRQLKPGVTPTYAPSSPFTVSPFGNMNGGQGAMTNPESDYITTPGAPGIYPAAQSQYQSNGWTPAMAATNDQNINQMGAMINDPHYQNIWEAGDNAVRGQYNANITPVGPTAGSQVDPIKAFSSMGAANPTSSIQQMLSGQVNTSALDPVVNTAMRRLGENFNEQVMPGIGQGAEMAGQYGGTRQGIAQGLAAKGLGYSMGDTAANMYNNAYNMAQSNMYGTANNMAGLGLSNANQNAARDIATQKFNANLGLNNNQQAMANSAQNMQNLGLGANLVNAGIGGQQNLYSNQQQLLGQPNDYNWNNLKNYASIVSPGAGIGGTTSSTQSATSSPLATAAGLGLTGLGAYGMASNFGLLGSGAASSGLWGPAAAATGTMSLLPEAAMFAL